jgi:hypothetical protein
MKNIDIQLCQKIIYFFKGFNHSIMAKRKTNTKGQTMIYKTLHTNLRAILYKGHNGCSGLYHRFSIQISSAAISSGTKTLTTEAAETSITPTSDTMQTVAEKSGNATQMTN